MSTNLKIACVIAGVLAYFAFPFELIPDVFFPIGYIDDAAVIAWGVKKVQELRGRNTLTIDV